MKFFLIFIFSFQLLFISCKKKEEHVSPDTKNELNHYVYTLMKEWYLWNDKIPSVNPDNYSTPETLLEAVKYKTLDRFSYIIDSITFAQYFSSGKTISYGCGLILGNNNKLYISYVYKNSPMDKAGVTRGYEITHINGHSVLNLLSNGSLNYVLEKDGAGVTTTFNMITEIGETKVIQVAKSEIQVNTVLHYEVKEVNSTEVGYLVFNSFVKTSEQELATAFDFFKANSISELIIDLRYNGGGMVDVANFLGSCILGSDVSGQVFGLYKFNKYRAAENDKALNFVPTAYNFGLTRLFIITSNSTASSSEFLINSLKPYMDVILIGYKTHGKPVGMYSWNYKGKVIVPITFYFTNKNNSGDYFNGIDVNSLQADGILKPFGSEEEDCFKAAITYIKTGVFPNSSAKLGFNHALPSRGGFRDEVGCY